MNKELLLLNRLSGVSDSKTIKNPVLKDEVKDVEIEFISIKGENIFESKVQKNTINVLLTFNPTCTKKSKKQQNLPKNSRL